MIPYHVCLCAADKPRTPMDLWSGNGRCRIRLCNGWLQGPIEDLEKWRPLIERGYSGSKCRYQILGLEVTGTGNVKGELSERMVRGKSVKEGVPLRRASVARSPVRVDLHYMLELLAVVAKRKRITCRLSGGARSSMAASQRTPGSRYSLQDGKSAAGMGYRWRPCWPIRPKHSDFKKWNTFSRIRTLL
jgi:hypothetical protein